MLIQLLIDNFKDIRGNQKCHPVYISSIGKRASRETEYSAFEKIKVALFEWGSIAKRDHELSLRNNYCSSMPQFCIHSRFFFFFLFDIFAQEI